MPFNIQPFNFEIKPTGFDLGKALQSGFKTYKDFHEAANTPRRLSEALLAAKLKNAHDKTINEYLPRSEEARIGATESNTGLDPFQQRLMEAQANKANRAPQPVLSNLEKAMQGYDRIKQQYGENSTEAAQAKSYVQRLAEGAQGVTVYDPETGQPMVQVGGSSKGGKGGQGVYENGKGEQYTPVTPTNATKLQNRIIGAEQLEPIIKDIMEKVPQFQSGWNNSVTNAEGFANRWIGGNFSAPSTRQAGHAALSKSAESLVNLFGLHANARNVEEVKNILQPGEDESAEFYKARVADELQKFAESKGISQKQLSHGLQVNGSQKTTENFVEKKPENTKRVVWHKVNGRYVPKD